MKFALRSLLLAPLLVLAGCSAASSTDGAPVRNAASSGGSGTASTAPVSACEQQHGLTSPTEQTKTNRRAVIHFTFRICSPGSVGAASDGYTQVDDYETGTGAGDDADDTDVYNFFTGPCTAYKITYGYYGLKKTFPAITLHQGTVTKIDQPTQPYTYDTSKFHIAAPGQGQAVLVDNGDAQFKAVVCQGATTTAALVPGELLHPAPLPTSAPTSASSSPGGLTPPLNFVPVETFTTSSSGTTTRFRLDPASQSALTWRCATGEVQQFGITVTPVGHSTGFSDPGQDDFDQVTGNFYFYPNTDDYDPSDRFFLNVTLEGSATCYIMVSQQS